MTDHQENIGDGDSPAITRLGEKVVYRNKYAAIFDDPVEFADHSQGSYLRIVESDGKPGVAMLAACGDQIALVRTYRYPVGSWEWGIPRGFAQGDEPARSARAELTEELGREPDELQLLGTVTPNSGILANQVQVFMARYSETVATPKDKNEIAAVRWIGTDALTNEISAGKISDAFTLSALGLAHCRGLINLSAHHPRPSRPS